MRSYNRRRRSRVPRYARLAIFVLLLALAVFGIVKLIQALSHRSDPTSAPAATQAAQSFAPETPTPLDGEPQDTPDPQAGGDGEDVDLQKDLSENAQDTLPPGGARTATIRSIGDIIIHEPLYQTARAYADSGFDFAPFFSKIADSMGAADYTVINVEGPLGGKGERGYKFYPQFNTPPHLLTALKDAGVDMLTMANNHALDTYFDGLKRGLDNVEKAGLDHVGAYRTQAEYDSAKIVEVGGIRVGILNYTTGTNNLEKSSDKEASVYGLRYTWNSNAKNDIASLRAAGAEAVVVYMHWGEEYERTPNSSMKTLAQKLSKYGADVIIGGHPHVVQPAEWIAREDGKRTLVLYSMGNFLSDQRTRYRDSGVIFEFTLQSDEQGNISVVSPKYVPTYVWRYKADSGYDYRVVPCGKVIENRPSSMSDEDFKRVKQVWNELKDVLGTQVAAIAAS